MQPVAELGLDVELVRENHRHGLPRWDPRLWPALVEELECAPSRSSEDFQTLGLSWAKHHLKKYQETKAQQLETTRPSHGRPEGAREKERTSEAPEDGRKGGAGRAQAQRAEHETGWAGKYDASDERVIKTAHVGAAGVHTVYVFDSLELRRTALKATDYTLSVGAGANVTETEVPYLLAHGVRLARVVVENSGEGEPRLESTSRQHVFFELGDHLGSTSVVLDKATSELVERSTYQAYGAAESDYRPDRWKGFREDYGFTGKEEDIEVGLQYFGKRFLSPHLGRWVSADPLTIHGLGGDLNVYAYVSGGVLKNVDPLGLCDSGHPCKNDATGGPAGNEPESKDQPASAPQDTVVDKSIEPGYAEGAEGFHSGASRETRAAPKPAPRAERNLPPNIGGEGAPADQSQNLRRPVILSAIDIALITITLAPPGALSRAGAELGAGAARLAIGARALAQTKKARDMAALESVALEAKALGGGPAATEGVLAAARGGLARDGIHYELKFVDRHLPGTTASRRLVEKEGAAHVFTDRATMEMAENAVYARGQFTGVVRGTERYGLRFENPIGYRIDAGGGRIPLHYAEAKLNPATGGYHVIPRTGPSSP